MPSLFRFVFVVSALAAVVGGGLFVLAQFFEPEQREVTKPVPAKIKQ